MSMSERKKIVRLDNAFLENYCKENGVELLEDYTEKNLVGTDSILAKCIYGDCIEPVSKTFRQLVSTGCYCLTCKHIIRKEKSKETCMEKYGTTTVFASPVVKDKIKASNLGKHGVECVLKSPEIRNKIKATNKKKYGVEFIGGNPEIREKQKQTMMKKYGAKFAVQVPSIIEKTKKNSMEKHGTEYSIGSSIVQSKIRATLMNKYGFPSCLSDKTVQEQIKQTVLEKYNVTHIMKSDIVKNNYKATCMLKYNTEYPMQNAEYAAQASKQAYNAKDYVFPSGRIDRIQGYEHMALNDLLQKYHIDEDDIATARDEVPEIWYNDADGQLHRYYVDIFIKSQNKCIEVKSTWTMGKIQDSIFQKHQAAKDMDYLCEIWVYDQKGKRIECHL